MPMQGEMIENRPGRGRPRGFDHLKTIRRTLQNLKGSAALANQLI